ncbi:MAG: hypothetical protein A2X67_06530 [Ignavibacteria bacterium GWA2_55_11]|nr:MAG: hypothetical protein A2X67_06530 [Ignavibacteria bacterium GWA2_55_11]OGU47345.1 MAG: hypothetical protein A2X68_03840 [Ignavibacteria bacterium GWC2_56_12]OGU74013.1 MAG: hypothetical protein A3H45_15305 [Ignavibacteria bacterium RIFCSPLOWO2_02_FULL_55_14]OGU75530.1 MAG: hypothetical protein A3G43_14250 [Ignavibacteria bacterium RIFCSPLOWO2_12_FULL_56_21]HAV22474.1 hypothetical protein [Bacteroidota bacterium]
MQDGVKIIENAYVLACDPSGSGGLMTVVVRNGRIAALLTSGQGARQTYPQAEVVDAAGRVLLPGFVDAHYHGESYILDILAAGEPADRWAENERMQSALTFLRERATTEDWVRLYRCAYYAALRSGITTIVEFGFGGNDAAFAASVEALLKTDLRGFVGAHTGDQIEAARTLRNPNVRPLLVLPPAEELTTYNLQTTLRQARDLGLPLITHLGETLREAEYIRRNFRKSSVQVLDEYQMFSTRQLPTHLSVLDVNDADILHKSNARVILAPAAAMRKGVELPPVERLIDADVTMVLGSDWGTLRPWENMRALWEMAALSSENMMSAASVLMTHTHAGAQLLGMDSEIGAILPGKRADFVFMRCTDAGVRAAMETEGPAVVSELLLHRASTADITEVMINGEFFVRESEVLTYAAEDLAADMRLLMQIAAPISLHTRSSLGTPVIAIPPSPAEEGAGQPFEEGFRVVRKENTPTTTPILPLPPPSRSAEELGPNVRKVFGDEDV